MPWGDPTRWVMPGGEVKRDLPIPNLDRTALRRLLGVQLRHADGGGEFVLAQHPVGLLESGLVDVPVHAHGAERTIGAALNDVTVSVPEGKGARIRAVSGVLLDNVNALQPASFIAVGVNVGPPPTGDVLDTSHTDLPAANAIAGGQFLAVGTTVPMVAWSGNLVCRAGDELFCWAQGTAAGDQVHVMVVYELVPDGIRTPV